MSRPQLVTVFGGSGFLGRYVVRQLLSAGYRVRVAVRRPDLANFLQPMGGVGQVQAMQANVRFPDSITAAVQGADHVISLVGILFQSGDQSFNSVIDEGAEVIAKAAKEAGLSRIIQISAIGADEDSDSLYAQSKALGEKHVLSHLPESIIIRPSIIFGQEDDFFNRFAKLAGLMPVIPLVGAQTKFQPVYVDDVASVIFKAVKGELESGQTYELGGARVSSFQSLIEMLVKMIERKRIVAPIPKFAGEILANFLQFAPGGLKLTPDQVRLLGVDNIVSQEATDKGYTLEGLGIEPVTMEAVLPKYLVQYKPSGEFAKLKPDASE